MTKNEALKAAIDGKKVRCLGWQTEEKLLFDGKQFVFINSDGESDRVYDCLNYSDDWQIVPEFVDFAEAWKAYEDGKTIKSIPCDAEYWVTDGIVDAFTSEQIRGKWLILEDE